MIQFYHKQFLAFGRCRALPAVRRALTLDAADSKALDEVFLQEGIQDDDGQGGNNDNGRLDGNTQGGFIRKLPHHLIEAFKSTLEEAKYADYILHVVDASNPQHEKQMHIVYDTLHQLDIREKTVITLFNKQDAVTEREPLHDLRADHTLAVSAREGTGLDELKELLAELLRENKVLIERTIAYADAGILQQIRKQGELLEEDYRPEGIYVKAYVPLELYGKL